MILFINGSFGVGKTTVGRLLRKRIEGSILFNPEWSGSFLMRLPIKLKNSATDDFQDIDLWRKSVVKGVRLFRFFARDTVIVPMSFYHKDYFSEIISEISKFDSRIKIFCLKASFETIVERLEKRGEQIEIGEENWSIRKARLCIASQQDEFFGETIDTNEKSAVEVGNEILQRLDV